MLEEGLLEIAIKANELVNKKEKMDETEKAVCSIFLKDPHYGDNRYVLRASTRGDFHLGIAYITITKDDIERYKMDTEHKKVGLTKCAILGKEGVFTPSVKDDKRWSNYGVSEEEILIGEQTQYCEYPFRKIGGLIITPIIFNGDVLGVIRIVNRSDSTINYRQEDLNILKDFTEKQAPLIESMASYGQLLGIGSILSLRELCMKAAKVIKTTLKGKGCSIFLLDEKLSDNETKKYRCFGTTGLVYKENGEIKQIEDPYTDRRATYYYKPKELEGEAYPKLSMTEGVIRARENVFIDDLYSQEEINKQFTPKFKIIRAPGTGKSCEYPLEEGKYLPTRSILYAPLFYRERSPLLDLLGVIRIVRPKGSDHFSLEEKHLFISLAEELSKTIVNAKYVELLNELAKVGSIERLFLMVVEGIPRLIGGTDCAIFIKEDNRLKKVAEWREGRAIFYKEEERVLEPPLTEMGYFEYDLDNPQERGYTGWVAFHKMPLRFNSPDELENFSQEKIPRHNEKSGPPPDRFLGVPILKQEKGMTKVFGVIRIYKRGIETVFSEHDEIILTQLSERLLSEIEGLQRTEELDNLAKKILHEMSHIFSPLRNYIEKGKKEEALRFVGEISSLIDGLRDYIMGRKEYTFTECKISEVIDEILKDYEMEIKRKGIECLFNRPKLERGITIDRNKIRMVFRNLIVNAIDAIIEKGEKEGKIVISMDEDEPKGRVRVIIEDNGCGIKEGVKDRLLKKMFVTTKEMGLGVGLFLSNSIIKDHRGEIMVKSKYGEGASFTVELPFEQKEGGN